ncbi:unnamed protein product [Prunus armeniaca]|uniref:Uncharacterized protein n=1 Tax=Prunus armeniaca TaxID=36596 RepID=A0A6J5WP16_PRUAR|nr:unnamed protein product [Prunus armeniaca]
MHYTNSPATPPHSSPSTDLPLSSSMPAPPPPIGHSSPIHTYSCFGIFKPNPKFQSNFSACYQIPQALIAMVESEIEPICYAQGSKSPNW